MSRLRAVLDQINDIEATIARIEAEATDSASFGHRITLQSLEKRRDVFREELADVRAEQRGRKQAFKEAWKHVKEQDDG